MKDQIEAIQTEALSRIQAADDARAIEDARVGILGKQGTLTKVSAGMRDVPKEDKAAVGQLLNAARQAITTALDDKKTALQDALDAEALKGIDPTLPARAVHRGSLHPLTHIRHEAITILRTSIATACCAPGRMSSSMPPSSPRTGAT